GPGRLGQQHRHVAGEITVLTAARSLDHEAGHGQVGRQGGLVLQGMDGLQHQFAQLYFHGWSRFRDGTHNPNRPPCAHAALATRMGAWVRTATDRGGLWCTAASRLVDNSVGKINGGCRVATASSRPKGVRKKLLLSINHLLRELSVKRAINAASADSGALCISSGYLAATFYATQGTPVSTRHSIPRRDMGRVVRDGNLSDLGGMAVERPLRVGA